MSLTALMTFLGCLVMLGAWGLVGYRMKRSATGGSLQVRLLRGFFLCMGLFCFCIFAPQITLSVEPAKFPMSMAWGYIIGHMFAYVAFTYLICLTLSMVPRLADKQIYGVIFGLGFGTLITVINVMTMGIGPIQPQYDAHRHVVLINAAPMVGALIGVFAVLSMFPAAIMMIMNGIRNPAARMRSFLLGGGLGVLIVAGPVHDIARSWQLYMFADTLSIVAFLILTAGILYRFEERIAPASRVVAVAPAPSV